MAAVKRPQELLLYVEDDDTNWEVAELRLKDHYRILRARTAEEACDVILTNKDEIAAILMDIQLQGSALDGIRLTRLLRGKLARNGLPPRLANVPVLDATPIIFMTAYASQYPEAELLEAGGNKALTKPVEFGQFMLLLANVYLNKAKR
jgi:CheY-like chemotaxis protein